MSAPVAGPVEHVLAAGCTLGEGPVWDAARECLWFTDIKAERIHSFEPISGRHESYAVPAQVGWVLPAEGGNLLAGLKDGLHFFNTVTGQCRFITPIPGEPDGNRLNDACVDSRGRVFFGSMDDGEEAASGKFYRAYQGEIVPVGPGRICITNGPAVSPGDSRIYFTNTLDRTIHVADFAEDGTVGEVRLFADTARDFPDAYPDGPVCDLQGCVWTGLWNGWGVARYAPDGQLLEKVDLPVANVTKVAFGGPDFRRVFVTTARKGLDAAALAAQPLAGDLFAFDVAVAGLAPTLAEVWG